MSATQDFTSESALKAAHPQPATYRGQQKNVSKFTDEEMKEIYIAAAILLVFVVSVGVCVSYDWKTKDWFSAFFRLIVELFHIAFFALVGGFILSYVQSAAHIIGEKLF